jgi:hypothetical protein
MTINRKCSVVILNPDVPNLLRDRDEESQCLRVSFEILRFAQNDWDETERIEET